MKENSRHPLDLHIQQKLEGWEPAYRPESWQRLADKLDMADAQDAFDERVQQDLSEVRVPAYSASSWAALAARLEKEQQRMQAVLHYKALELCLLLLALALWQAIPSPASSEGATPRAPVAQQAPVGPHPVERAEYGFARSVERPEPATAAPTPLTDAGTQSAEEAGSPPDARSRAERGAATTAPTARQARADAPSLDATVAKLPPEALTTLDAPRDAHAQLRAFQAEKAMAMVTPTDEIEVLGPTAGLPPQAINPLAYDSPGDILDYIKPIKRQTFARVGFVGSPDYNRVITPPTIIRGDTIVSLDRYALGYSGGITLGLETGRWEIETGITYAARRYQTIPALYLSGSIKRGGYTALGLRDFELNTVQVPLNIRYNFWVHDRWRLYAQGGASLNVVVQANYYLVDEQAYSLEFDGGNPRNSAPRPEALTNKSLVKGWWEGGPFWHNATLFGNVGMGVERYMSHHWSVFAQPTYQHSFLLFNSGLGPYNDQLHTFSIYMGVKVRL